MGTLKAVVEYFRDVAREDRYFAVDQSDIDTDALARTVQGDVRGRVEVSMEEGGVVLRASPSGATEHSNGDVTPANSPLPLAPYATGGEVPDGDGTEDGRSLGDHIAAALAEIDARNEDAVAGPSEDGDGADVAARVVPVEQAPAELRRNSDDHSGPSAPNGSNHVDEEDLASDIAELEAEFAGRPLDHARNGSSDSDSGGLGDGMASGRKIGGASRDVEVEERAGQAQDRRHAPNEAETAMHSSGDDHDDDTYYLGKARRAVKLASPGRAMLTETRVEEDGESVSRLMDETQKEFEEPEGNRRRSAIAHLRAAVAATRADRLIGRRRSDADETEAYREDLANVVQPRRPKALEAKEAGTERPAATAPEATERPAPLTLVAEQRVVPGIPNLSGRPAGMIQPRRVHRREADGVAGEGTESFADFARSMGARELPELLEAAAAYLCYVERLSHFSRPQLTAKLSEVENRESSREDRLQSFGQLLREGKITKLEGGTFTASDRIAYKPSRATG
ncbi:hypothetical protein [Roseivivax halodurans]|uniref:hypothetical protein n=1 Tax=Roseivivax halodurans TaxID=93683 RepID=UPI001FCA57BC|nr:hypothetical protein [Roseivivax halodurans]